jgi:hypothetical protein
VLLNAQSLYDLQLRVNAWIRLQLGGARETSHNEDSKPAIDRNANIGILRGRRAGRVEHRPFS